MLVLLGNGFMELFVSRNGTPAMTVLACAYYLHGQEFLYNRNTGLEGMQMGTSLAQSCRVK